MPVAEASRTTGMMVGLRQAERAVRILSHSPERRRRSRAPIALRFAQRLDGIGDLHAPFGAGDIEGMLQQAELAVHRVVGDLARCGAPTTRAESMLSDRRYCNPLTITDFASRI